VLYDASDSYLCSRLDYECSLGVIGTNFGRAQKYFLL
jgi:hypothetical protein